MHKTRMKSKKELRLALSSAESVAIISCGFCANWNGVGGLRGIRTMKKLLLSWGKNVVKAKTIPVACCESIMKECIDIHIRPVLDKCDALVIMSCAGGLKSAFLCDPGIPVIGALDSVGSTSITRSREITAAETCSFCGNCVLSFTCGICPENACPLHLRYGPCKKAPISGHSTSCVHFPDRECCWRRIIEKGGDLEALKELEKMHGRRTTRPPGIPLPTTSPFIKRFISRAAVRTGTPVALVCQLLE